MARSMQEMLLQPLNHDAPLSQLTDELCALGVSEEMARALGKGLNDLFGESLTPHTVNEVMSLTQDQVHALEKAAGFRAPDSTILRMCMGSSARPFAFQASGDAGPHRNEDASPPAGAQEAVKKEKGGAMQDASARLTTRRDPITSYFPPPDFDEDAQGQLFRQPRRLRTKITKEVEDVCGDLYPTCEELAVILRAIQSHCGPPDGAPSWNWWWSGSKLNGNSKKHKGTAISDIEKARRNPGAYGCHGQAVEGTLRPARPMRTKVHPGAMSVSVTPAGAAATPPLNGRPTPLSGAGNETPPEAENEDLNEIDENHLLARARDEREAVDAMRAKEKADKQAEADRKKAQRAEKAAKKREEEKEKAATEATNKRKGDENAPRQNRQRAKQAKKATTTNPARPVLSPYEQKREDTIARNAEWLNFIERTQEQELRILSPEEAGALIGKEGGRCVLDSYPVAIL